MRPYEEILQCTLRRAEYRAKQEGIAEGLHRAAKFVRENSSNSRPLWQALGAMSQKVMDQLDEGEPER